MVTRWLIRWLITTGWLMLMVLWGQIMVLSGPDMVLRGHLMVLRGPKMGLRAPLIWKEPGRNLENLEGRVERARYPPANPIRYPLISVRRSRRGMV
jgi:hypothetical protein